MSTKNNNRDDPHTNHITVYDSFRVQRHTPGALQRVFMRSVDPLALWEHFFVRTTAHDKFPHYWLLLLL